MRFAGVAGAGVAGAGVVGAISDISVTGSGTWPTFLSWNPDKVWYKGDFKYPPKHEMLYINPIKISYINQPSTATHFRFFLVVKLLQ